jgi:hypothetical protein
MEEEEREEVIAITVKFFLLDFGEVGVVELEFLIIIIW